VDEIQQMIDDYKYSDQRSKWLCIK
jgi:hypothetical protein